MVLYLSPKITLLPRVVVYKPYMCRCLEGAGITIRVLQTRSICLRLLIHTRSQKTILFGKTPFQDYTARKTWGGIQAHSKKLKCNTYILFTSATSNFYFCRLMALYWKLSLPPLSLLACLGDSVKDVLWDNIPSDYNLIAGKININILDSCISNYLTSCWLTSQSILTVIHLLKNSQWQLECERSFNAMNDTEEAKAWQEDHTFHFGEDPSHRPLTTSTHHGNFQLYLLHRKSYAFVAQKRLHLSLLQGSCRDQKKAYHIIVSQGAARKSWLKAMKWSLIQEPLVGEQNLHVTMSWYDKSLTGLWLRTWVIPPSCYLVRQSNSDRGQSNWLPKGYKFHS